MEIAGFEWDAGSWPKCGKHGVSRAIDKTHQGRYVFLVFMLRKIDGLSTIRPISARYMHQKEIDHHERQTQTHPVLDQR